MLQKKSGLLSILPEPRNAVRSSTKSLIPNSVAQKPQTSTAKRKDPLPSPAAIKKVETKSALITDYSDDSDNEEVENDFFSIHKKEEVPLEDLPLEAEQLVVESRKEPRSIESYFKKDVENFEAPQECVEPSNRVDYYSLNVEQPADSAANNSNEMVLDDEAVSIVLFFLFNV